jgi:hypothetical protein
MQPVEEPVVESAPLAWRMAPQLCHRDAVTGEDCSWYHGLWQFLRLMGLAGSASDRGDFYQRAIQASVARMVAPRILISGAADYAMLAQVIAACHDLSIKPAVTVVDVCETPLHLNRWYGDRASFPVNTSRSNLLDYSPPRLFDLICTDSILGRFPPGQWGTLARKWKALLNPGGAILTASRLRQGAGHERIGFTTDQAQAFRDAVLRGARERHASLGIDPQLLARGAEIYAERQSTYAVRSTDQFQALFEDAGFAIEELSVNQRMTDNSASIKAPTVPRRGEFLQVVARHP